MLNLSGILEHVSFGESHKLKEMDDACIEGILIYKKTCLIS